MTWNEKESLLYSILEEGYKKESKYDYLVLFSGGKDSSYIVHKLKSAKGARICLFTVDNGFENSNYIDNLKKVARDLQCDLYIHQPNQEELKGYYKFLLTESELLKIDSNPLCFFCNRYLLTLGVEFAEHYKIPFVFHGATPEQISKGETPQSLRGITIFNMVQKKVFMKMHKTVQSLKGYRENKAIQDMVDKVFYTSDTVRFIFPFQFWEYNVNTIKNVLEEAYNWQNPVKDLSNELYISSGCKLTELFGFLEKKSGFAFHELDEFSKDYGKGIINKEAFDYNMKKIDQLRSCTVTEEIEEIARSLDIEL